MNRRWQVTLTAFVLFLVPACGCLIAAARGQKVSTQTTQTTQPQSVQTTSTQTTQVTPSQATRSDGVARGRRIYFAGEDGSADEIRVVLGNTEIDAPATAFACANCHGADGEGTSEGGIKPARINWEALNASRSATFTGHTRPPYDDKSLARAIRLGINSAGEPLQAAMPRYQLTDRQTADLISFLKILGTDSDLDPGLTPDSIKVGAALPLTGPHADIGQAVRATLTAYFAEANARGGVYGRHFELVVADSGSTASGTLDATRELLETRRVFALVGSFEPPGETSAVGEYLRRAAVPLVGPLTLSPKLTAMPNPSVFYLLPTARDQARALVEYIRDKSEAARGGEASATKLAVVNADDEFNREAADGARSQANASMTIALSKVYRAGEFSAKDLAAELVRTRVEYVLFFGGPAEFAELGRELERQQVKVNVAGLSITIGREALNLPTAIAARTFLAHPTPPPERADLTEFVALLRHEDGGAGQIAFRAIAFTAAKALTEAVKLSGRRLNRAGLVSSLEQLRDFKTGVLPPLTFGPNRRLGATGAYIVGVDLPNKSFTPLSDWIGLQSAR
jgi:ABC-type branched-subunit amino acid transport system substrate-binding protein